MRNVIEGGAMILVAFLAYTALGHISPSSVILSVNIFFIAVILFAVTKGDLPGALMGMVCGLIVDSFSLGVFGIAGVTNTVTGYAAGYISRKINVLPSGRIVVLLGVMGVLDFGLWILLTAVLFGQGVPWPLGTLLVQPVITAGLGTAVFAVRRRIQSRHER